MNLHESKYYKTSLLMNEALLLLLEKKDFEYITIKEICKKAGVNRSTFYLHYENMNDLLEETLENKAKELLLKYPDYNNFSVDKNLNDLYLFTPKIVMPYLSFLRENKKIYKLANNNLSLFRVEKTTFSMYEKLFYPIMEKFKIPDEEKKYIITFYMNGLNGIFKLWLDNDCSESDEFIADLIFKYVKRDNEEIN